jgi:hypothetical protein
MFRRIAAALRRFFTGTQRGTGILPVIHGLEAHATTNTVLQVDDGVIGPQSDHLELNPKGSVDSLKVTLTKDEVKNG